ncbi:hypothetical protein D9597_21145 [Escherichia sp. E13S3]|nr:hypothetical protein D9597_21145 [Escherichia sp. E13S3]TGC00586.1 hypothetical protein CRI63_19365 [Escherichia sp. E2661]
MMPRIFQLHNMNAEHWLKRNIPLRIESRKEQFMKHTLKNVATTSTAKKSMKAHQPYEVM